VSVVHSTQSDDDGQFVIPPLPDGSEGSCRLSVRAKGYATFDLGLPAPGRAKVHLVSVRRTVLERFVNWARHRGQPFDSKTEPTPGWVADVARTRGHPEIEQWALAVNAAAFSQASLVDPEAPELLPPRLGVGVQAGAKRSDTERNG
jgi:hypothetical protein